MITFESPNQKESASDITDLGLETEFGFNRTVGGKIDGISVTDAVTRAAGTFRCSAISSIGSHQHPCKS